MSTGDPHALVQKHRSKGWLLIDTNILLLYMVGSVNPRIISDFKPARNKGFGEDEFHLLARFIHPFRVRRKLVTTPHVLTEIVNLSNQLKSEFRATFLSRLGDQIEAFDEKFVEAKSLCRDGSFPQLGLTDCGILHLSKGNYLVLTEDFELAGTLKSRGIDVVNFNHLRQLQWQWIS